MSTAPSGKWARPPTLAGMPALGMHATGTELRSVSTRMASRINSGPVEQLSPMTSTPSDSRMATTAPGWVPRSMVPLVSSRLTEACSGTVTPVRANASREPKIAAFTSRMSCAVSMMSRSLPPSISP